MSLLPVNVAAVCRQIANSLRADADLLAVLSEEGAAGSVYANQLPETMPGRAVLVQRAKVPGGAQARIAAPALTVRAEIHLLYLADASEGDPAVILERIHQRVYAAGSGTAPEVTGHSQNAMRLVISPDTTGAERYDDRFLFSAAFGRVGLSSTLAA